MPGKRNTGPLRPVNPFMVQDPKQKARRLARALISDMLVYHPEKRQQGIRDGTLPQLFKDEIEKSWQEYVEQVGADMAQSTPFWTRRSTKFSLRRSMGAPLTSPMRARRTLPWWMSPVAP